MPGDKEGVASKIIRIGNSRGVRIPKPLLEQAGLDGPVRLRVVESGIIIERRTEVRDGWGDAAERLNECGDDGLLDPLQSTRFDESDWTWE